MILDRRIAPIIKPIRDIKLLDPESRILENKIELLQIQGGDQEIVSIQLIYPGGRWFEAKKSQAFFTSRMITEGTISKSSQQIAEIIDFHGAQFSISASYDDASINIVALAKHLVPIMSLLSEIIQHAQFPENELLIKKNIAKQKLLVNAQKTDFVCQREFLKQAYGQDHPYGYLSSVKIFDDITVADLKEFYSTNFQLATPIVIISGNYSKDQFNLISDTIGNFDSGKVQLPQTIGALTDFSSIYIPFENANQTSIRFGRPTIKPNHKDYAKLQLTNAILGGYFGSRLMSNLREEKGLTYGVSSHLGSFDQEGYWFVGTDVGKDSRDIALEEIKKEISKLQNELVPIEELELVRNYLMGKKLANVDGPFAQARLHKALLTQGQSTSDFHNNIDVLLNTTADDVMQMAQQYFPLNEMVEVLVG